MWTSFHTDILSVVSTLDLYVPILNSPSDSDCLHHLCVSCLCPWLKSLFVETLRLTDSLKLDKNNAYNTWPRKVFLNVQLRICELRAGLSCPNCILPEVLGGGHGAFLREGDCETARRAK